MGKLTPCHLSCLTGCDRHAFNVLLDLENNVWTVQTFIQLPDGVQPQITPEELNQADEAVRRDANVIKLAAEVGITASQIRADGWSIGYDDRFGKKRRLQQCLVFARFGPHENLYAHPLDFFPVLDSNTFEGMQRRIESLVS
jgi:primary-amine oxidase